MAELIPAIIPEDYEDIESRVKEIKGSVSTVQLDIMDGTFVAEKSWPYHRKVQNGKPTDDYFQAIQREETGPPWWEEMDYELDLMIDTPDEHLDQWIALGPKRIILHIESLQHPEKALQYLQSVRDIIEIGLSFDDEYEVTKLNHYLEYVDFVQVMGIDEIGYQGQEFEPRSIYNITYLREKYPDMPISVDGAVNEETIKKFKDAGANRFVAGSAVFAEDDPKEAIETLHGLL